MEREYKVVNIIWNLKTGGAENLLKKIVDSDMEQIIVTLDCKEVSDLNYVINLKGNYLKRVFNLFILSRKCILNIWLYKSIVFCFPFYFFNNKVIFSIHHDLLFFNKEKISTKISILFTIFCSRIFNVNSIFVSKSSISSHLKYGYNSKNLHLIYNGTSPKYLATVNNFSTRNLIFVGKWSPIKNIPLAVEIIERLLIDNVIDKVFFVGFGLTDDNQEFINLIKSKKIPTSNIEFFGVVNNLDVIYDKSSIMLISSFSESLPLVFLEGLSFGIPCFSTKVGDIPLFLDSDMFLFERSEEAIEKIRLYFELSDTEKGKIKFEFVKLHNDFFLSENMILNYKMLYENLYNS